MNTKIFKVYLLVPSLLFLFSFHAQAETISVDCDAGDKLADAVDTVAPGSTILVSGTCHESITIRKNDLTLVGNDNIHDTKATISGVHFPPRVPLSLFEVDGAVRISIVGFILEKAFFGINAKGNASVSLTDLHVNNNFIGVNITTNSSALLKDIDITATEPGAMVLGLGLSDNAVANVDGTVNMSGSVAFGFDITASSLQLNSSRSPETDVVFNSFNNTLGGEIAIGSTFFANRGSTVNIHDNATIGFSCNTGSTCMFFHAKLNSKNNGLDGVDVVSRGNLNLDGNSTMASTNNGREGISIDDSTLNLFGFFADPGLPNIISTDNTNNGVLVEFGGKLDVGRNSSIEAKFNGDAGVRLDDGSSAIIQRGEITDNAGMIKESHETEDSDEDGESSRHHTADVIATFGSRISFRQNPDTAGIVTPNIVGKAVCDRTSMARGDVKCKRRKF